MVSSDIVTSPLARCYQKGESGEKMCLLTFEGDGGEAKDPIGARSFFEMMLLSLSQSQNVPSPRQVWFLITIFRFLQYHSVYPYTSLLHVISLFQITKEDKTKNLRGDPLPTC